MLRKKSLKYPTITFVLSFLAGIFIFLSGITGIFALLMGSLSYYFVSAIVLIIISVLNILFGILIILMALMFIRENKNLGIGASLIIIFSMIILGYGPLAIIEPWLLVGSILGIVGGTFGLIKK